MTENRHNRIACVISTPGGAFIEHRRIGGPHLWLAAAVLALGSASNIRAAAPPVTGGARSNMLDELLLASGSNDQTIKHWRVSDGSLIQTLTGHSNAVFSVAFSPVVTEPDLSFCQRAKLLPSDGERGDLFGRAVSIDGDVAVIGATQDEDNGAESGSVYVFRFNGSTWMQEQKLLPDDGEAGDHFGEAVAVSGDVVVIGAPFDDSLGSAYVFRWSGSTWVQEQKLLADDGANDWFGFSVSLSDGLAVIGAERDNDNGADSGSAYVFRWNDPVWEQEQKLLPDDGAAFDHFSSGVSVFDDVAIIGARGDDVNGADSGSVYVFRWNGANWVQEQKLLPDDGDAGDWFGNSVSLSGNVAVIGARVDDQNGELSGSAYVFRWNGVNWAEEQKLLPADGAPNSTFGDAVSVASDVILIGASSDDDNGLNTGSAYVFRWNGEMWVEEQKLLPDDATLGASFGTSVSISGEVGVIGAYLDDDNGAASGSAYIFSGAGPDCNLNGIPDACDIARGVSRDNDRNGIPDICTNLCEVGKLLADDGSAGDNFGLSVSVSHDVALIGADLDDDNGTDSGSAYVLRWNSLTWNQEQKLLPGDGAASDHFGYSVSLSGNVTVIGAYLDDDNGSGSGSAYVFRWNGSAWVEEQKLLPDDGAASDNFGFSVSVSGDVAVIGAYLDDDNGSGSGSAYVFRWNGLAWIQEQKLLPDDGAASDYFGFSVSVSGDEAVVGTYGDDDNGYESGSAYVFRWNGLAWVQEQKLLPDDGADRNNFGFSVSVSGDVAVIGAPRDDDNDIESGSAYAFRWTGFAWVQEQKLLPDQIHSQRYDHFGWSVAVVGDVAAIGAVGDRDNGFAAGAAYVLRWDGLMWGFQEDKLLPVDGVISDEFGISVSVTQGLAIVGAHGDDDRGPESGSAYTYNNGVDDCNENDVFDLCDIQSEISGDCKLGERGVPDECEVPQVGAVESSWVAEAGLWSNPASWCLPEVPDNNVDATFAVTLETLEGQAPPKVTLDVSPSLDALTIGEEATLQVDEFSGADARSIFVENSESPIQNNGTIRAIDGKRLLLDAADVRQMGQGLPDGEVVAEGQGSRVEVNGRTVTGGVVKALDGGLVEMLGGGEFVDVDIQTDPNDPGDTVLVVSGQSAFIDETITNTSVIIIGDENAVIPTFLIPIPREGGVILEGNGRVEMKNRFSRLGDFNSLLVNRSPHRIEGAGRILGAFTNEDGASIIANHPTDALIITAGARRTNHGALRATDGGTLSIAGSIAGNGAYRAEGGTIHVETELDSGPITLDGSTLMIAGQFLDETVIPGTVEILSDAVINLTGSVNIEAEGLYHSAGQHVFASLTAETITITSRISCEPPDCPEAIQGGAMILDDYMSVTSAGDLTLDGTWSNEGCRRDGIIRPPKLKIETPSRVDVYVIGNFNLERVVELEVGSQIPVRLDGDFNNHIQFVENGQPFVECFDWRAGGLLLAGEGDDPQTFEVAGLDLGPRHDPFPDEADRNFEMGRVEIAATADVTFADDFDNIDDDEDKCEALYIGELVLRQGASVTVDECRVYYQRLINEGVRPFVIPGCGSLLPSHLGRKDYGGERGREPGFASPECFTGPDAGLIPQECRSFDYDFDDDVDLADFAIFQRSFVAP